MERTEAANAKRWPLHASMVRAHPATMQATAEQFWHYFIMVVVTLVCLYVKGCERTVACRSPMDGLSTCSHTSMQAWHCCLMEPTACACVQRSTHACLQRSTAPPPHHPGQYYYTVFGQFLVWATPSQQLAQVAGSSISFIMCGGAGQSSGRRLSAPACRCGGTSAVNRAKALSLTQRPAAGPTPTNRNCSCQFTHCTHVCAGT